MDYRTILENRGVDTFDHAGDHDFLINCPFHDDNHPSLEVHNTKGVFYCFGCHETGSFIELLSEIENIPLIQAQKILLSLDSVDMSIDEITSMFNELDEEETKLKFYSIMSFHKKFEPLRKNNLGMNYVLNRNIDKYTIKSFDLRWADTTNYKWKGRVIIPVYTEQGKLLTFAGRTTLKNLRPKTRKVKGRSPRRYLYGLYELLRRYPNVAKFPYLILVEGEFDAMYLQQFGIPAVSTMGTMGLTGEQVFLIKKFSNLAVVSYDGDDAGRRAQERAIDKLKQFMPVVSIDLPEGFDPNELSEQKVMKYYKEYIYDV